MLEPAQRCIQGLCFAPSKRAGVPDFPEVPVIVDTSRSIDLVEPATQELLDWVVDLENSDISYFEQVQQLATKLGAHYRRDGLTEVGFWAPELSAQQAIKPQEIFLEILTPIENIDFRAPESVVSFRCNRLRLWQHGEYLWGVIRGMRPGTAKQAGSLYWLRYLDARDRLHTIRDPMAYSLPFGIFAPAELYDMETMQAQRPDLDYFRDYPPRKGDEIPRVGAPKNILQLHVGTAAEDGTLESLAALFRRISEKLARGMELTPAEKNYIGYDAVQLLPIEPTIEYRSEEASEGEFFHILKTGLHQGEVKLDIQLRKPNTQDWGYDIPVLGASAVNPALLGSLRPQEIVDFAAALHNFSTGPIQLIYDLVYGHADNQSEELVNRRFLKGPNMYGQDLNHQLPTVRAILLETQRRKINTGADGIRVDGGQDFRFFNPLTGRVEQDDAYLLAMSDVVQEIGGYQRLMFTIFEDGRPWPEEGWEEKSTYLDLIELKPESYQWGPLIFAHNTPALNKFWDQKWRRVCEVIYRGAHWITGCANHDTVRRGNQIDLDADINWHLGSSLPEVLHNAYDNQAVTLWVYGFSPGLPMDFINATSRAPWMFFRNTDERYGVKVVSEEIGFLYWQVTPHIYQDPNNFPRLKELGFERLEQVREFGTALSKTMVEMEYHLPDVVRACQSCLGESAQACELSYLSALNQPGMVNFLKDLTIRKLKDFARRFMEDCYGVCNVFRYQEDLDPVQVDFNCSLRRFRHQHPWLDGNLTGSDRFNKYSDEERTIYYGVRSHPENASEQVAMVAHMGGEPGEVSLEDWLQLDQSQWQVAIASPSLRSNNQLDDLRRFQLCDSQGVLLVRK
nr:glucosylglycerol hydrolase [Geitlerinema sp. PCC 9228]